jgi:hypothetical protein
VDAGLFYSMAQLIACTRMSPESGALHATHVSKHYAMGCCAANARGVKNLSQVAWTETSVRFRYNRAPATPSTSPD